jgi:Chloroplast import apparatus Tic20-like/EF-hand domain pair
MPSSKQIASVGCLLFTLGAPGSHGFAFAPQRTTTKSLAPFFKSVEPRISPVGISSRRAGAADFGALHASLSPENDRDSEIERLRSMAAKLRAEAAALEAEQAEVQARAVASSFAKFDLNQDGQITMAELKEGLESILKTELSEKRVQKLLENFDTSGDGALQLDEFVTVEQLRNKLEALARDEKQAALELKKKAKIEEEALQFLQAQMEILNDRAPTGTDKLLSILPYLFPLLDGLQFARFLVLGNPENPISIAIGLLYALYRSIPFGGFIAFLALNLLSGNPSINRLIRFNMQQAIYLDIALFFPGLLAGLYALVGSGLGLQLPQSVTELGTDAVFFSMVALVGYAVVSSLLGVTPDKIPFISNAVSQRMPSIDMFDASGRFLGSSRGETDENEKDKKDS